MKKRLIITTAMTAAVLLSAASLSGCSSPEDTRNVDVYSAYGGNPLGKISYTADGSNVTVTKYTQSPTGIIVPGEIDGKKVVGIGKNAFNNENITVAVLPDSVRSIGERAFGYAKTVYSDAADDVAYAGDSFATGVSLSGGFVNDGSVYFLESDFQYEENDDGDIVVTGFLQTPITVVWPEELDNVTAVGGYAFMNASLINFLEIPSSLTNIGDHAFYNCTGLKSINITGDDYISGTADLSTVTSLGDWAFGGCGRLSAVTLSDSLMEIGTGVFSRCYELEEVDVPASVVNIGEYAFNQCSSLQDINVSDDNKSYTDVNGVLFTKDMHEILKFPEGRTEHYDIPDGVSTIGVTAFSNCENYQVTIPKSVRVIENRAFKKTEQDKPTEQMIPGTVTEMDTPIMSDMLTIDFPDFKNMVK